MYRVPKEILCYEIARAATRLIETKQQRLESSLHVWRIISKKHVYFRENRVQKMHPTIEANSGKDHVVYNNNTVQKF